jgi:hypothetical protein
MLKHKMSAFRSFFVCSLGLCSARGTLGDPHFRSPAWPEDELQTEDMMLDLEAPEEAEPGPLEPGDTVVDCSLHNP